MDLETQKELVTLAQKKDPEAFGRLFDENYPKIFGYILKRTGNVFLAEDLTSDTFFKALKNIKKFRWRGVSFSAWLYRIATNEINSYYRKNKVSLVSLERELEFCGFELSDLRTPQAELEQAQTEIEEYRIYLKVQKEVSQLKVKYQQVLALRFFAGKKIREISIILKKSEGTIKSLLFRGLNQLKSKLEPVQNWEVINNEEGEDLNLYEYEGFNKEIRRPKKTVC